MVKKRSIFDFDFPLLKTATTKNAYTKSLPGFMRLPSFALSDSDDLGACIQNRLKLLQVFHMVLFKYLDNIMYNLCALSHMYSYGFIAVRD